MFTSTSLSSEPHYLFNRSRAFSWLDPDLQIMSMCKWECKLLLWTRNILTFETTLIFSFSIVILLFRYKSEFVLSNCLAYQILLFENYCSCYLFSYIVSLFSIFIFYSWIKRKSICCVLQDVLYIESI